MQYTKQDQYDEFVCIASNCPASCCCGWQIVIDDESKKKYRKLKGSIGKTVRLAMDEKRGIFRQNGGRCALLREDDLCELQKQCGEEALCKTCRMYPRHEEEFENIRELSLSMSCPEAARMMLTSQKPIDFETREDEQDECYEAFDFFLYDKLVGLREVMYRIAGDKTLSLRERMERILILAYRLQEMYDDDRLYDADNLICGIIENEQGCEFVYEGILSDSTAFAKKVRDDIEQLRKLERLRDEWGITLQKLEEYCFQNGEKDCLKLVCGLLEQEGPVAKAGEKLLVYFLYTIFCGAVYNGMIFAKAALICHSVTWILLIAQAEGENDIIKAAWTFCREVEHSNNNLNTLEDLFDGDYVLERSKKDE